jgi:hypothetical protein
MPIVFKLVGITSDKKYYEIRDKFSEPINLELLYELYITWGLTKEEISHVKFITDSVIITNPNINFPVSENEDRVFFVFTSNIDIRKKLQNIFIKEGNECQLIHNITSTISTNQENNNVITCAQPTNHDKELCTPITQVINSDPIPILTPEIIESMNIKSINLFSDPDFKNLVSIFIRKPELFSVMAKYVQNGNVIQESLGLIQSVEMLSDDILSKYKMLCIEIKNLGINVSDEVIIERLIKYSGHLNLTVRSLLCELSTLTH